MTRYGQSYVRAFRRPGTLLCSRQTGPWRGRNAMARKDSRPQNSRPQVSRRRFLSGVAIAGAAGTVASQDAAKALTPPVEAAKIPAVRRPTAQQIAIETEIPKEGKPVAGRPGSDFMVD